MKKFYVLILAISVSFSIAAQSVGIGTGTPDASAQLDVVSATRGFLPPRMALTASNVAGPVASPATGLLIYNTATAGTAPNNVVPGYYYWNGGSWYPVINRGNAPGDMQYWNGTRWINIPIGVNNAVLTACDGIPQWGPCSTPVTLNPQNNQYEGFIQSPNPDTWISGQTQLVIGAWTSGPPFYLRSCLKFDYTQIPSGAIIDTAVLYLFANPNPAAGNFTDAMYGSNNACYIQRITSSFVLPTPFTWNNPPIATTANQALLPQSNSSFENSAVNVSALVRDMRTFENNGFYIRMINENPYNIRQYLSSYASDPTKVPRLLIKYH